MRYIGLVRAIIILTPPFSVYLMVDRCGKSLFIKVVVKSSIFSTVHHWQFPARSDILKADGPASPSKGA